MTFRKLQSACKAIGVNGKGSYQTLQNRLLEAAARNPAAAAAALQAAGYSMEGPTMDPPPEIMPRRPAAEGADNLVERPDGTLVKPCPGGNEVPLVEGFEEPALLTEEVVSFCAQILEVAQETEDGARINFIDIMHACNDKMGLPTMDEEGRYAQPLPEMALLLLEQTGYNMGHVKDFLRVHGQGWGRVPEERPLLAAGGALLDGGA